MKSTCIYHAPVTYVVVFDKGEEVISGLMQFAKAEHLSASHLTAIGAFSDVTTGYFEPHKKEYLRNKVNAQVEVLSLLGDIALYEQEPKIHAHVVIGKADGTAHGGHLLEAHVWPTLEVVITASPVHLRRQYDPETGLALIAPDVQQV